MPTFCDKMQRLDFLHILKKGSSEQILQFVAPLTQQLVEVANCLLICSEIGSGHLGQGSFDSL